MFIFYVGFLGVFIIIGEVFFCVVCVFLVIFILVELIFYEVLIFIFYKEFDFSVFYWRCLWFRSCFYKVCVYLNYLKCMVGWGLILWICLCCWCFLVCSWKYLVVCCFGIIYVRKLNLNWNWIFYLI